MVPENRISFQLILTIVVVALSSVGRGDEVRWIEGQSYPHPWSIELTQPIERETVSSQPVYFVDANATGTSTGLSWGNAFTDLQSALGIAVPGSEIRVARGIYRPQPVIEGQHTNPNATFKLGPGVVLKGGYAGLRGADPNGRDVAQYETILSGDLAGDDKPVPRLADLISDLHRADNAYHVVTLSETDSSSVLDGFTITGGVAIDTNLPDKPGCGGGIYNDGGSATVHNCKIFGNAADYHGGGIYTSGPGSPTFATCMVAENWAQWTGGAMYAQWSGTVTISQCVVTGNGAQYNGGAISAQSDAELLISNCILSGNMAAEPVAGGGGALYSLLANVRLSNCTIVGNTAAVGTALVCEGAGSPGRNGVYLGNCIVWGEGEVLSTEEQSGLEVVYSDVRGGWPGQGNIDADPCFVEAGHWDVNGTPDDANDDFWVDGNYRLLWDSPCIDAGDSNSVPPDYADLDGDGNKIEPTPLDLDYFARFIDGDCNDSNIVDMGAYEFLHSDINHNGAVNFLDFAMFALHYWETNCGMCGGADLTCDHNVNGFDLLKFAEWWLAGSVF